MTQNTNVRPRALQTATELYRDCRERALRDELLDCNPYASMTRTQAKRSVLLANSSSAVVVMVLAPLYLVVKDSRGNDWLFWLFIAAIPLSIVAGAFGLIFSLEQSLTRKLRCLLFGLNGASLSFGLYLSIILWRELTAWSNFHQ